MAIGLLGGGQAQGAVDLEISGTDSPDPVVTPGNLTYTLSITNVGTTAATGVSLTNLLSPRVNFVSVATTRGSCSNVAGVVYCDWATVDAGAGGRVTIVARPTTPGIITNVVSAGANEADENPANNLLTQTTTAVNRRTFASLDFIQVDEVLSDRAVPYPSTIAVSGLTAAVHKVTVTLNNISHTGPDDLDILLVGPNGSHVMLLSDGPTEPALVDVTVTFDDAAAQPVPDTNAIATGTYKPANYGSLDDIMPTPAPAGPHRQGLSSLAIFNGIDPNGDWHLYVYDDEPEAGGWVDGWSLTISTMQPLADVGVSVVDSPDPAVPGDIITYTTTITNLGPVGATGVRLTNQVPAGLELISYVVSRGNCTNAAGVVFCDIGELPVGATEQLVVQARTVKGGSYTNRAEVRAGEVDAQPGNNVAAEGTLVEPRVDLVIGVTSSRTPALLEQPLIYTLAITNLGPDTATGVRVTDELPPGVTLVNAVPSHGSCSNQNGVVTCNLGPMANGSRASVFLTCRPTVLGPITNVVSVASDQIDSNPGNNAAQNANTVEPAADLLLGMTDRPDPGAISHPLTYSISLTNRGPNAASNIVVSDALPASLQFVSAETTRGVCTNDGNSVTCLVAELPIGERVVVSIIATANSLGTVANTATVTGQPVDPNVANNTATVSTLVNPAADISVTKASDRGLVWEGDRITYNLVVSNHGPSTATGTRLNDSPAAGLSFVSATASAGSCTLQSGVVVCTFGDIPSGGFVTVSIVATALIPGELTNTALAVASEQDLNPANNLAVVVTTVIPRTATPSDTNAVVLPELGPASTYPLTINVSGMTAAVQRVRVTLPNLSHSYPDDLDVLLVGPGGQALVVMSDAGGSAAVTNRDIILDDLAAAPLPDMTVLSGLLYRPADYEVLAGEFPAPAPAGPYVGSFDVFAGTDPNGPWKLYIVDDATKDAGVLGGGWRLDFWMRDPMAELGVAAQVSPELVAVGSNVTVAVIVSNNGPALASAVILTNAYGSDLVFSSATATQGSCTNDAGIMYCALGGLAPGSSAAVQMAFTVMTSGTISNLIGVSANAVDLNPSNNETTVLFVAENPPAIWNQPRDQYVFAGGTATFEVQVAGDPPLSYQWYHNDAAILGATTLSLTVNDVQIETLGDYRLQVSNRVALILSDVARLSFPRPPVIEPIADQLTGEDQVVTVPLVVTDPDNPAGTFLFSAVCEDTNLVPVTNLSFTVNETNYALVILPGTNQFGTNIITLWATNSMGLVARRSFALGVESVNDYPEFIVPVQDQVIPEDGIIHVPFVIGDVETEAGLLITGARIYNPALIVGIGLSGSDSNRVLTLASFDNRFGSTVVEIRLRDENGVRTTNLFTLTVLPVEDAPTISSIDDVTMVEDGELRVGFSVDDVETASEDLLLSAESSNPDLFANAAFVFDGTGNSRGLSMHPLPNQHGSNRITVFVEDEAGIVASNAFWVTVDPVNDWPFVSLIPEVVTAMDQTSAEVPFTVGDLESDADSLTLTAVSTNAALIAGIEFGGGASNRTVRVTPEAGQFGWTVLRLDVTDPDGGITSREFELTVHQTNGPPVIALQPESQVVTLGSPATLRVIATGPGTLSYRWQRNGTDLPDQTNALLTIASTVGPDRGEYRVVIANDEGSITSAPAQLTVLESTRILSLRRVGETVELTFGTVAGQRYFVEFQDAVGMAWTALPEAPGTGENVTVTDPEAVGSFRLYRVRVE